MFDDGDRITHRLDDVAAVFPDEAPTADQVNVATHIVAKWKGSGQYFKGFVTAKPSSSSYEVTFDDGDKGTYTLSQLRILPDHVSPHNGKWGRLTKIHVPNICIILYTIQNNSIFSTEPQTNGAVCNIANQHRSTVNSPR